MYGIKVAMERIVLAKATEQVCLFQTVKTLKMGGVVALPTDTVYGLCAGVNNADALEKIFVLKGRAKGKPVPIFIHSLEALDSVAYVARPEVRTFLESLWPGKVTCVLPARGWMPSVIFGKPVNNITQTKRGFSIGVRIPSHPFLLQVLKSYNYAITATSANVSGRGPYTSSDDVVNEFEKMPFQPDLVIDAGQLPDSLPSTVVDCTLWPPAIIREGAVSKEEIHLLLHK